MYTLNEENSTLIGYFDGASRGNPGVAGAGSVIVDASGAELASRAEHLGRRTNNEAEYKGLINLLELARGIGAKRLTVRGDSKLVVSQMKGEWRIKEPRLAKLASEARSAAQGIDVVYEWVPRERNKRADELSNIAIDEAG